MSEFSNGHRREAIEAFFAGLEVEPLKPRPIIVESIGVKPCCKRLGNGSWCNRDDNHTGECTGAAPTYGPIEERPLIWRSHKGQK